MSPTQSTLGMHNVLIKITEIEKIFQTNNNINSYRQEKIIPVVIGPEGKFYILDGHHSSRALLESSLENSEKFLIAKVEQNFLEMDKQKFWDEMLKRNWVNLYHLGERLERPADLPDNIDDLEDDFYRSLASVVRKNNGFRKIEVPFQEFYWARYFRSQNVPLPYYRINNFFEYENAINSVLSQALLLAHDRKAQNLPGYIPL